MSYAQSGPWFGCVKSTLCRGRRREPLRAPEFEETATLEMDGLWTRTRAGATELQVIRDAKGVALGAFGSWEGVIDQAWQQGAVDPAHLVSDGDPAIAAGLGMVYGRPAPHQLCQFHLLREYRRNIGGAGWTAARQLLAAKSVAEAQHWAQRVVALTGGQARYWCRKALREGLRHLTTGQERFKTTSRLERHNRELRRREKMGTVWSPHNLTVLLQNRGLINQTT